jgi:hypothetical protein
MTSCGSNVRNDNGFAMSSVFVTKWERDFLGRGIGTLKPRRMPATRLRI